MKKRIIIPIVLLVSGSMLMHAQENARFNTDGTTGSKPVQNVSNVEGKSTRVDINNVNIDGTPKSHSSKPQFQSTNEKTEKVDIANVNPDGTPKGSVKPQYTSSSQQKIQTTEDNSYRAKGDVNNTDLTGKNVNAPRKAQTDIPDNSLIGTNDDAVTRKAITEDNKFATSHTGTANFVIPESDRHLSDTELNKKYPDRNTANTVKPATGSNDGISDKDRLKTAPKSEIKPATSPQNNKLSGDELNRNRK